MTEEFQSYIAKDRVFGPFTFDFLIADEIGKSWYDCTANQFMPERQWCFDHIQKGFTVLDCGSHHGMMTILFALMTGPTGRVIAWDALPRNAETVRQNAALNHCPHVTVHGRALGEKRETLGYAPNSGNVMLVSNDKNVVATSRIEVVPLDDDIDPSLHVDFLKLDVEGSELSALRGAKTVLRQRPLIDLELHNFLFLNRTATLDAIFAILDQYNYAYEVLPDLFDPLVKVGTKMDIAWLGRFENPHVFCSPLP